MLKFNVLNNLLLGKIIFKFLQFSFAKIFDSVNYSLSFLDSKAIFVKMKIGFKYV